MRSWYKQPCEPRCRPHGKPTPSHPCHRTCRMKRSPVSAIVARARLDVSAKCCPRSINRRLAAVKVSASRLDVRVV